MNVEHHIRKEGYVISPGAPVTSYSSAFTDTVFLVTLKLGVYDQNTLNLLLSLEYLALGITSALSMDEM